MKYNLQFFLLKYTTLSLLTIGQTVYCQRQGVYDDSTISEIEIDIDILNIPSFILNGTNNSDLSILNNNVSISDRIIFNYESEFQYMGMHITQVYQDVSYISQILFTISTGLALKSVVSIITCSFFIDFKYCACS